MVMILALLFILLAIPSILTNSVTIDEFAHIPVGYAQAWYGLYHLESANPPLVRMFFGAPIDIYHPRLYWGSQINTIHYHPYCYEFEELNLATYHQIGITSRVMVLLMTLLLGFIVYYWCKQEYGETAGFFALFLCWFNPNILAHGTLATLDLGLTLSWLACLFSLKLFLDDNHWYRAILFGVCLGIAQCSKFTSILLYPMMVLIFLLDTETHGKFKRPDFLLKLAVVFLVNLFFIGLCYRFEGWFTLLSHYHFRTPMLITLQSYLPGWLPVPLPSDYLSGFDLQLSETRKYANYLNGQFSDNGSWYFYFEGLLLKNPIPFLIIVVWTAVLYFRQNKALSRSEMIWFIGMGVITLFFSFSRIKNIGLRYILPAFPFMFMYCGKLLKETPGKKVQYLVAGLLLWQFGAVVYTSPQYLGYYNELVGGPRYGYRYFLDSNTDWGQDFIRLKDYMTKHNLQKIWFTPSGPVHPKAYGIEFHQVPPTPVSGLVFMSVNHYYGIFAPTPLHRERYAWLRQYKPVDYIGDTIWIYNIPEGAGVENLAPGDAQDD